MKHKTFFHLCITTIHAYPLLSFGVLLTILSTILFTLLPPMILASIIDTLSQKQPISFYGIVLYFVFFLLQNVSQSVRDSLFILFGQKVSHTLRSEMMAFYTTLDTKTLNKQSPGAIVSRFLSDVDTLENLFTEGIISLIADSFTLISILVVLFKKTRGTFYILLALLPILFLFTRIVQKRMLKSEIENRNAIAKTNSLLPETLHNLLTIQNYHCESFMESTYSHSIDVSYQAIQKTNFYDAIYSPIILITNSLVVAFVVLLAGNPQNSTIFGMSAGTALMCMQYISKIFTPIESLGMEIQTMQSSIASLKRIQDFFTLPQAKPCKYSSAIKKEGPILNIQNISFHYEEGIEIIQNFSMQVEAKEQITLKGRTGAGKSTLFKLILGLYTPTSGSIKIFGIDPYTIEPTLRRKLFGYVEQSFHPIPGSIKDQITLSDVSISTESVKKALKTVGLWETVSSLPYGLMTTCKQDIFSQGQWQLLSIARAIVCDPPLLLLDEITADLDSETEKQVLQALSSAMQDRTVISISHRTTAITGKTILLQHRTA